ncbi:hypothetical protein VOLCADRAFT_92665 [Volvox carteri f. nagariensis]|uniref:Uncharacterized protein n=1 Tax=Volvox carteri f. nagariensis TaxID=3068 RepID=D8U080_VOLCA|nr:uncharacterized protein VOLCADRAFT_92665 [Volvox carteri f. nagariensis]EFJ46894.1 hypothetical protein VOLCADRAFT_92665 [Volvox carteri f. nagariensis]|eukprot:XP_002952103.1 hypothetical protein VOLCADRAFT_92665 [Volvox carteri f. nagariensis]
MGDYVYYRNTSARASLDPHAKPDILRVTEGVAVMRESKGRGRRTTWSLGVASYAGRRGRSHVFQVVYDSGEVEVVSVSELCNRVAPTHPSAKKAMAGISEANEHPCSGPFELHTTKGVSQALARVMPGEHNPSKVKALVTAGCKGIMRKDPVRAEDVSVLTQAIAVGCVGSVFIPWKWDEKAMQQLRDGACTVRYMPDKATLYAAQPQSFAKARSDGVAMPIIGLDISEEVMDVVLPVAYQHAEVAVIAAVPRTYITPADPACLHWLRAVQRDDRLSVLQIGKGPRLFSGFLEADTQLVFVMMQGQSEHPRLRLCCVSLPQI